MRYGVIADVHGNLEALTGVLGALSGEGIDAYLSVGDIIGYGADPRECLRVIKGLEPQALVAGNHEWGALDILEPSYFNDMAKASLVWTKGVLVKEDLEYIGSFSLMYEDSAFTVVHGSYDAPEEFNYITNAYDAGAAMKKLSSAVCFVGHTHAPGTFYESHGIVTYAQTDYIHFERNKKYVVNVGSVGQPRDGDPRACYAVYDASEGSVEIKRVEYDIASAQKKIIAAGLPGELAMRLGQGV